MGLFRHDNVMDWHRKNKITTFATAKSRQKAEAVFEKCCQHSSQDQLLEYAFVDRCWFIPVALKYMDDEHLIQYACRKPAIETNGYITEEEKRKEQGEVLAVQSLHSSEAIAELYLLYRQPGVNSFYSGSYGNQYGKKRREALESRIGETEAAYIIRRLRDNGEAISPDSWLAQKITNDELKHELGLDVTKDWVISRYKEFPELKRAQLLRSMLTDDEIIAVLRDSRYSYDAEKYLLPTIQNERFLAERLLQCRPSDIYSSFRDLVRTVLPLIKTPELLDPLLFMNPLDGFTAIYVIQHTDNAGTLLKFRKKLISLRGSIYQDEESTHFMNKRPEPSDNNLIILVGYNAGLQNIWFELNLKIKRLMPNDTCTMKYVELYRKN
ncbi:MAG: hypothetical protein IKE43_02065 [Coriobacteriales bacterium]|nr:hypothetical protein [Coriobacteriales bacterium]